MSRSFTNTLPCTTLQGRWIAALRAARRSFTLTPEPQLFGSSGQEEIVLHDRPEHLGITLGSITTHGGYTSCKAPLVWAFGDPS